MKPFLLFLLLFFMPRLLAAQMFSVQGVEKKQAATNTYLRLGSGFNDFVFKGDPAVVPEVNRLDFEHNSINAMIENSEVGFELSASLAGRLTGLKDITLFTLSAAYMSDIVSYRQDNLSLSVPVKLGLDIAGVNGTTTQDKFSQSVMSAGVGGKVYFKIKNKLEFVNQFIPGYGFSSSRGGFFGGSAAYLNGKSRINFLNLFGNHSLSLGYDFKKIFFDIDGDNYDYNLATHLLSIGISF